MYILGAKNMKIAVLGAGNGGYACSADLSLAGYIVNLYELPMFKTNLEPIINNKKSIFKTYG